LSAKNSKRVMKEMYLWQSMLGVRGET